MNIPFSRPAYTLPSRALGMVRGKESECSGSDSLPVLAGRVSVHGGSFHKSYPPLFGGIPYPNHYMEPRTTVRCSGSDSLPVSVSPGNPPLIPRERRLCPVIVIRHGVVTRSVQVRTPVPPFADRVDRRAARPSVATASPVRVVAPAVPVEVVEVRAGEKCAGDPNLCLKSRIDRPQLPAFGRVDELP